MVTLCWLMHFDKRHKARIWSFSRSDGWAIGMVILPRKWINDTVTRNTI